MANARRDLTFSIVSDDTKFDTDQPARDLDDLGRAAVDAGRDLARLDDDTSRLDLDQLGDDAKATARRVDDAFDTIARASRQSTRKVDDDADDMRRNLRDVGDEAGDSAREMAASFSGGTDDVLGAFQEISANAGTAFGPVGLAAGAAMGVGIGLLTAKAEELKEMTSDLVQDMLDAGGKLTEAAITNRVQSMAAEDPGGFTKYNDAAVKLGVSIRDVARARAGDAEAAARVLARLDELDEAQRNEAKAAGNQVAQRSRQSEALAGLRAELALTAEATALAEDAVATATTASAGEVQTAASTAGGAWDDLRANLGKPISARVVADFPSQSELDEVRRGIMRGIGTIVVPVKPGQSPTTNTADNSRYRW